MHKYFWGIVKYVVFTLCQFLFRKNYDFLNLNSELGLNNVTVAISCYACITIL